MWGPCCLESLIVNKEALGQEAVSGRHGRRWGLLGFTSGIYGSSPQQRLDGNKSLKALRIGNTRRIWGVNLQPKCARSEFWESPKGCLICTPKPVIPFICDAHPTLAPPPDAAALSFPRKWHFLCWHDLYRHWCLCKSVVLCCQTTICGVSELFWVSVGQEPNLPPLATFCTSPLETLPLAVP